MIWWIFGVQVLGVIAAVLGALIATYGRRRVQRGKTLSHATGPILTAAGENFQREGMELYRAGSTVAWVGIGLSVLAGAGQIILGLMGI